MRIGIIGNGIVGNATAQSFKDCAEVLMYDVDPKRSTHTRAEVLACDLIFICLPTPQKADGPECDTSAIDGFFASLDGSHRNANFILKSTVPVGYTRKARERYNLPNLVHSPEFLTARTAVEDACNPTRLVIGIPEWKRQNGGIGNECSIKLEDLYKYRFDARHASIVSEQWHPRIFVMSSDESEAVKLFQNAFSAIKIASFNEFRTFADKAGLDWQRCLDALLAGGWINPMHTQVPGPDGKRGYGGNCLPKDIANLQACIDDAFGDCIHSVMCESARYWTARSKRG